MEGKEYCILFDIGDDLSSGKRQNFTLRHFISRMKIYESEGFDFSFERVEL